MKDIVIIGAGDFGKEVAWLISDINKHAMTYRLLGYLDDDKDKIGREFGGFKCLGPVSDLMKLYNDSQVCAVIAMQNGDIRKRIVDLFPEFENWETLIHPSANISDTTTLGKGCVVCAGVNVSVDTKIGSHCLFNISATIGHDCEIGEFVSIMAGAAICGHVKVKGGAYLATNCTVIPGMKVGNHATVGAGSVVLRNVKDNTTVMGVPAKLLRL